ncbi:MAG: hypothetical protein ABI662_12865, partial [Dermatophilaceae bacterium]
VHTQIQALHSYLTASLFGCGPALEGDVITMTTVKGVAFCMRTLWDGLVAVGAASQSDVKIQRVEFDNFLFDSAIGRAKGTSATACVGAHLQLELEFTVSAAGQGDTYTIGRGHCL